MSPVATDALIVCNPALIPIATSSDLKMRTGPPKGIIDASAPTRTQSCEHALWFECGNFSALASDNKLL